MSFFSPGWTSNMKWLALLRILATVFLAVIFCNGAGAAAPPAAEVRPGEEPIQVIADTMSYNQETHMYVAYGNAEIHQVDRTLKADIIEYHHPNLHKVLIYSGLRPHPHKKSGTN